METPNSTAVLDDTYSPVALTTTTHCGTISSNQTWSSTDNVHVVTCNVSVPLGATLTISEGAIVKFQTGTSILVQGALRVLGSDANPVYLTSIKDDTIGGDTNNDGEGSSPAPGDWSRIEFQDSSDDANSLIDHAIIRYGGNYVYKGYYYGGITLLSASPTIQNTTLASNQNYAIRANLGSFPTLTNNAYTNNGINGLALQGGTFSSNATWNITDTAYFIIDDVTVGIGTTLTVNPGVVVKFDDGRCLFVQGALRVLGTSGSPVYFTSKQDDIAKGDTNNDGAASTPEAGNWSRIEFQDSSDDANSLIDHAIIRYGGSHVFNDGYYGGITLLSASPTIQNTTLASNQYYAIRADLSSFPTFANNTYTNNGINGLALQGGTFSSNATWNITDTAYFIIDDVTVGIGTTLTINPGVVIKFEDGRTLFVQGALRVLGTAGNPVYFTSKRDDIVKGDTNNDGAASTPEAGNWSRIEFQDTSDDANSLIDHAIIRYGGNHVFQVNYYGSVTLLSASPTIQNTTLASNQYYAIRADLSSFPTLTNNTYTNNGINGLALQGGTFSSNATWNITDTAYFIIDDVTVGIGTTLTVNPGVVVKFDDGRCLFVQGALRVLGTSGSPAYFTSKRDDTVKGDTNNDGAASTPGAGNWSRIEFQDSSDDANSLIDHAIIRYGGIHVFKEGYYGSITLLSASPTIQNTTLASNQYYAIRADLSSFPTLANNTYTNNGINGLALQGGTFSSDATWNITDTAYFIIDDVTMGIGTTLTINPGVVIKFEDGRTLFVQGALRVLGTAGNPVYFTSKRDDIVKGDTNNDGAASTPEAGNWSRIEFQDTSDDANSLIDYAYIRYGGSDYNGGITLKSASPTIQNSVINNNQYFGIRTTNSMPPLVCNNIYSNNSFGIFNTTISEIVNAQNQWWGALSGPYNPATNPTGLGNQVSGGVIFIPWSTESCGLPVAYFMVYLPLVIR